MGAVREGEQAPAAPARTVDGSVGLWAGAQRRLSRWRGPAGVALPYVVSAGFTTVFALWFYRPWRFRGTIASLWGDPLTFHAWVQATMEGGWYENASRLAAPYSQNSHTYNVTDEFLMAVVGKVLAPLTGSAGAAVLWWVIICFPLAAVFAVGAARYLGVGRAASLIPGIVFPLLPDHLLRAIAGHYSLCATWTIPLGLIAAFSLLRRPRLSRRGQWLFGAAMLVACVVISLTNAYYAVFVAILVAVAAVGGALAARSWRVLATGAARSIALVVPIGVATLLDRIYAPNPLGYSAFDVTRSASDSELYGGKIFAMLLPASNHRFSWFRALRYSYDSTFPNAAEGPALGLVAAIGFLGLGIWAILAYFRRQPELRDPRLRWLSGLLWVSVLIYTVGGLGTAWAFFLHGGGLRVWSRMHVVIALIALLAVAICIDRLRARLLRAGVVVLIVLVAFVDQVTPYDRPDPAAALAMRSEVTQFTDAVAASAGPEAMIYQAPQVNFLIPNRATGSVGIYDGFLPYLFSHKLRWSYGGLQGDPAADWQIRFTDRPFSEQAVMLTAAGFGGVVIDTAILTSVPQLEAQVNAVLGAPDAVSTSGRWQYFALDKKPASTCSAAAVAELGDLAVAPPTLYPGPGIVVSPSATTNFKGDGTLHLITLRHGGWPQVTANFTVSSPVALTATFPDGSTQTIPAGSAPVTWSGSVTGSTSSIVLTRTGDGGAYTVSGMTADAHPSAQAASCLAAGLQTSPAAGS